MPHPNQTSTAALAVLIILQAVMLGALYAGVPPHPPAVTPLFAIAPFLGVSMATAVAAILLGGSASRPGRILSLLAATMALISFGPQKYLDAQFGLIWPAVIAGQLACLALFTDTLRHIRSPATAARQEQQA
ncbi:hypothetical protein [Hoeflea sp.]|uniref:hypothetical protein n=1 Tax=Hoeflea sp. TaxID=1940281 RepID=UPI003A92D365